MIELTRNEELILLSIWKLKDNAYGVTIRENFKQVTGKALNYGSPSIFLSGEDLLNPEKAGLLPKKEEDENSSTP